MSDVSVPWTARHGRSLTDATSLTDLRTPARCAGITRIMRLTSSKSISPVARGLPRIALVLVIAAAALSCTGGGDAGSVSPAQRKAIADEIERSVRDAYDLTKPSVDERMLSLYPDTGRIVSASGGSVITSRDSLAQGIHYFWRNIGLNMRQPKWIWDQMLVDVLSPTAAVLTATYHVPHTTPRGQPHTIGGAWTMVFVKRDGHWRIVQEHLSDLPTATDSAAAMPAMMDSMPGHKH